MRAQDVMSAPVVTVGPEVPAKQAAALLSAHGFTALPVVDEDERLIGIVTEADLMAGRIPVDARFRGAHGGPRNVGETVADVMSSPCTGMAPGADLSVLARVLLDDRIRAVPIVEPIVDGSRVVGIVTRGDIIRTFARPDNEIAADVRHHLEIYGGPGRWEVEVRDGNVRILDTYDDETDRHVATLLAEAVPGVVSAHVSTRVP
jgi:CBS-domain-containing membrane protein